MSSTGSQLRRRRGARRCGSSTTAPSRVAVEALAVDAHRGGDDDAPDRLVDQRLEQHGGAEIVDRDVALDRVHALADADFGGEMDDAVDARKSLLQRLGMTYVPHQKLGVARQRGRAAAIMYLFNQTIEEF